MVIEMRIAIQDLQKQKREADEILRRYKSKEVVDLQGPQGGA